MTLLYLRLHFIKLMGSSAHSRVNETNGLDLDSQITALPSILSVAWHTSSAYTSMISGVVNMCHRYGPIATD